MAFLTVEGSASRAADGGPHRSETAPDTRMLDADSPVLVDSDTNRPEATNRSAVVATAADTAHRRHSWAPCGAMLFLAGSPSCSINLSAGRCETFRKKWRQTRAAAAARASQVRFWDLMSTEEIFFHTLCALHSSNSVNRDLLSRNSDGSGVVGGQSTPHNY